MSRQFPLGHILSVATPVLVCRTTPPINGVYEILNFMTGEDLYTHQLPRAIDACKPALLKQHPDLADVDASGVTHTNWKDWLEEQEARFGEALPVDPLAGEYEPCDPLEELADMVDPERIIPVLVPAKPS